jgi:signal transduction histidine kinase
MDNVTVDTLIEETIRSLQPRFDEKNQKLEVKLPKSLPQVYADPDRLGQILTNLVSNANKYTPADGKIRIHTSVVKKTVRVEVIDTGIGISEEDQKSLFSQFFRSEDTAVREQQGWGLGLNVTKRLVELMGGEIGMESTLGKGSTFWFNLPVASDEQKAQKSE